MSALGWLFRMAWRTLWWVPDQCTAHGRTLDGHKVRR